MFIRTLLLFLALIPFTGRPTQNPEPPTGGQIEISCQLLQAQPAEDIGCAVEIDGLPAGERIPAGGVASLSAAPGTHQVVVRPEGPQADRWHPAEQAQSLTVTAGQSVRMTARFERKALLVVSLSEPNLLADFYIGAELVASQVAGFEQVVAPGASYRIRATNFSDPAAADIYTWREVTASQAARAGATHNVILRPTRQYLKGFLELTCVIQGSSESLACLPTIDDLAQAPIPAGGVATYPLTPGTHNIRVALQGPPTLTAAPISFTQSIRAGVTSRKTVTLRVIAPTPTPTVVPEGSAPVMNVVVLVDLSSEPVGQEAATAIIAEADTIMFRLTGIHLAMAAYREIPNISGGASAAVRRQITANPALYRNVQSIVLFSYGDNGFARTAGGYQLLTQGPSGYSNPFVSPTLANSARYIYGGVIHYSHRYAICGYGADNLLSQPVQATSSNGECRNQAGLTCVQYGGYSMCPNATGDLYASTPTYMVASSIVHEIGHSFGEFGNYDHIGAPQCVARDPRGAFTSLAEAQLWTGLCPYIWDNLRDSY